MSLIRCLKLMTINRVRDEKLFRFSPAHFRTKFREVAKLLNWGDWHVIPYSLRRGGATWHFQQTGSLDATVNRGRWLSARTARIYIEDGIAQLSELSLTPDIKRVMVAFARLAKSALY
jgi:hypothetical protein